jgi:GDP-L-fucose synthase
MSNDKPMDKNTRIYVGGHNGMVGSAILDRLRNKGYANIVTRTRGELDLTDQRAVREFFRIERVEYVVLAAAKVGGIQANNTYPADFIYQNMMIEANVIHEAYRARVRRLLFLGSSCIYPKETPQPMKEEYLLTGKLESTNTPYAIAKIAGITLCESYNRQYGTRYRSVMPTNLFGPNDNFDLENSHVIPALIRKFHLATLAAGGDWKGIQRDESCFGGIPEDFKAGLISISRSRGHKPRPSMAGISKTPGPETLPPPVVRLWGTGNPCREFLYVDDLAEACVFVMSMEDEVFETLFQSTGISFLNVGSGKEVTIRELAEMVSKILGCESRTVWDASKPDGPQRKLLDASRLLSFGWEPEVSLREGIERTYDWYLGQARTPRPV